jgi:hypothetical protein
VDEKLFSGTSTLGSELTFTSGVVTVRDIGEDRDGGSYKIILAGVRNPGFGGACGCIIFESWSNGTNTIIEESVCMTVPAITVGAITNPLIKPHATMGTQYLTINDRVVYGLSF